MYFMLIQPKNSEERVLAEEECEGERRWCQITKVWLNVESREGKAQREEKSMFLWVASMAIYWGIDVVSKLINIEYKKCIGT